MTGRTTSIGVLVLGAVAAGGCGGGSHFVDHSRPAVPVNVSVYVNDQRVSVSPQTITPGPVTITITNQSSSAEPLEVAPAGGSGAATTTGPISPQANAQVTVDLRAGQYTIGVAPTSSTQAAAATPTGIMSGLLTVSGQRGTSNNQVLQP